MSSQIIYLNSISAKKGQQKLSYTLPVNAFHDRLHLIPIAGQKMFSQYKCTLQMKALIDNTNEPEYDIVVSVCVLNHVNILYLDVLIKRQQGYKYY